MPLADTSALHEWGMRQNPPYRLWFETAQWVASLGDFPWQFPSVELTPASGSFETRCVELESGVVIVYAHHPTDGMVELLRVAGPGE